MNTISEVRGVRVLSCEPDGVTLAGEDDAVDLVAQAFSERASVVVVPADRVADDFYSLHTRVAGEVVHKFAMYRIRLVIVGDISRHLDASPAFRAFVHETNRGSDMWFLTDQEELVARLAA